MNTRLQAIEQLCQKYQVKALYVFGSRSAEALYALQDDAYELKHLQSDLDIGILPHVPFSLDNKVSLTVELEELFNVSRVDLVVLQEADAFLAANIIRGERLYAKDSYLADEYDLFVLRRAGDLAALERERMAMILQEG
jgi:predicted nucleotidyltransferase